MRYLIATILLLTLAGCVAPIRRAELAMPAADASHYDAPDGRRWVLHLKSKAGESGERWIMFTPEKSAPKQWKESLSFVVTSRDLSQAANKKTFRILQNDDPQLTYKITGSADDFLVTYHSPKWNERGVQRVIRRGASFSTVYYQERLGPSGLERIKFWKDILARVPNQSLVPTPMSVTAAAVAPAAPATGVAHL